MLPMAIVSTKLVDMAWMLLLFSPSNVAMMAMTNLHIWTKSRLGSLRSFAPFAAVLGSPVCLLALNEGEP